MKAIQVVQYVVGMATVAGITFGVTVYAIDHSSTLSKVEVPTCQELYDNNLHLETCSGRVDERSKKERELRKAMEAMAQELCKVDPTHSMVEIEYRGRVINCK